MPRYELMYILASSVSDDQLPEVTGQINQYVADFGGTDIQETQLGKKKLAYPIKKTRNGFYGLVNFEMESKKINSLDSKIRTQDSTIIRYILVNLDEHLARLAKDEEVQAKMMKKRPAEMVAAEKAANEEMAKAQEQKTAPKIEEEVVAAPEPTEEKEAGKPMDDKSLDEEIEKAISEELA